MGNPYVKPPCTFSKMTPEQRAECGRKGAEVTKRKVRERKGLRKPDGRDYRKRLRPRRERTARIPRFYAVRRREKQAFFRPREKRRRENLQGNRRAVPKIRLQAVPCGSENRKEGRGEF